MLDDAVQVKLLSTVKIRYLGGVPLTTDDALSRLLGQKKTFRISEGLFILGEIFGYFRATEPVNFHPYFHLP